MRTKSIKRFSMVMATVLFSIGCDLEPGTLESLQEAVKTISAQQPVVSQEQARVEPDRGAFVPSNPSRVDPFSFPATAPISNSNEAGTTIPTAAQVEVLGFANVHEPRVFLRIKDLTRSLGVGGVSDGVEVLAIKPPAVDLQMGSLRWTATMFDQ